MLHLVSYCSGHELAFGLDTAARFDIQAIAHARSPQHRHNPLRLRLLPDCSIDVGLAFILALARELTCVTTKTEKPTPYSGFCDIAYTRLTSQ